MSDKTKTVTPDTLVALAEKCGCTVSVQTAFYRITHEDGPRKAVYVGKAKKGVTRVDLAGFTVEHEGVKERTEADAKELKLGAVRGQILPKELRTEDVDATVLSAFKAALKGLTSKEEGFKLSRKAPEAEETEPTEEVEETEAAEETETEAVEETEEEPVAAVG